MKKLIFILAILLISCSTPYIHENSMWYVEDNMYDTRVSKTDIDNPAKIIYDGNKIVFDNRNPNIEEIDVK